MDAACVETGVPCKSYTGNYATYYYDSFGNIVESTGVAKDKNSILYAGYQYDKETGLYYLNARMYDPKIARFLQEDTYTGDPNDPLSLNLYTYVKNNPLIYYDPTSHFTEKLREKFYNWLMGSSNTEKTAKTGGGWDANASLEDIERWDRIFSVADDSQKLNAEYAKVKYENSADEREELVKAVKESVSITVGFTPLDGIKDAADFIAGKDVVTGQKTNRIILGIMIFAPEAVDKGLRKYAKSGKNVAEESVERILKNNIQESSEAAVKRSIKSSAQESAEAAIKREIKKSDRLVEASTGIRFADNINDFGKVGIPELPKNEVQKNFLEVTRAANNVGSGIGGNKNFVNKVWKKKIVMPDAPHTNGTPGHWFAIKRKAVELPKMDDVEKVFINKGLSNIVPDAKPNRRPDIMVKRITGLIDQFEVPSKTDVRANLIRRMVENSKILGDKAGNIEIIEILDIR